MIFTPTANVFYSLIDMVPSNKKEIILCPHKKKNLISHCTKIPSTNYEALRRYHRVSGACHNNSNSNGCGTKGLY